MEFNDYLRVELNKMKEDILGLHVSGYENGKTVETKTRIFLREQNPLTEISATLLIPEKYYKKFMEKVVQHNGVRAYISYLLFNYKIHIATGLVPAYRNFTTKYQEKNQNLIKIPFRPVLEDWAELKLYRISFGLSISAFLVYLLIADFIDFASKVSHFLVAVGIPLSPNLILCGKVYLCRERLHYSTVFQYRGSKYS
ncbi:MAG: DUF1564 family protein [Leptospiraceae bacterium]|nr:DUF1564 family protein [Leptospiraceae bacterium]